MTRPRGAIPARPQWLDDEPEVLALLGAYLDRLDARPAGERSRVPAIRITRDLAPALHSNNECADRTWALLRSLHGQVFEIRLNRRRQPYDPEYLGASLAFPQAAEAICRAWLGRPRRQRYQEAWEAAVEAHADAFADRGACLRARPIRVPQKPVQEVVAALAGIGSLTATPITLRQLSARAFWGHSKVLDAREELLTLLFPGLSLAPRPGLVQVCLPEPCHGVLFIENLDSYLQALAGTPGAVTGLALVYSAGFAGSAGRVRDRAGVSLHYQGGSDRARVASFEAWWFDGAGDWPSWFWGDLDFSGMAILKALRQRFGDVRAWQPGYAPLLQALHAGQGHAPDMADKSEQTDPGMTGCEYADRVLLPAMRSCARFIDQEAL